MNQDRGFIRGDPCESVDALDRLLREFYFQPQRIGEAVGQVREASQHMDIHDLRVGEMFLEFVEIRF